MTLEYAPHQKVSLKSDPQFNEKWLHETICDDPAIIGLGDVRVIDRERVLTGGGRLDMLLYHEENNQRFEVEIMLGATDPSHIIRSIEYWDIERRRYPGYDHIAVLIAEDITARFLNVMALLAGSIPLIAIQLNALAVGQYLVLDFVHVIDQADLRIDDTDEQDTGGGEVDRAYWEQRAGPLIGLCDQVLQIINEMAKTPQQHNYLRSYIGLRSDRSVGNYIWCSPKPTKKVCQIALRTHDPEAWKDRFVEAGVHAIHLKGRYIIWVSAPDFQTHQPLIREAIENTIKEFDV